MRERDLRARDRARVLEVLAASGQSVAEFCREQGLPYALVARWRREAKGAGSGTVGWVEVEAEPERAASVDSEPEARDGAGLVAEVALGGGVMIRVYRREGGRC